MQEQGTTSHCWQVEEAAPQAPVVERRAEVALMRLVPVIRDEPSKPQETL